ncbi:E3-M1/8-like protein [Phascolarctid gammaherpesvirus 1]|uniref:E3-M1/8-like protein n=1 Tax=Phascolarctid gammaherpesvirus 1 TaxID=2249313 RepID=A0A3S8D7V4_9GAMA|nr:E3-M1/8-like protein [Phascolarctid gammaherpesvirus 1]AZB49249.1 E3-M1/8-like protein [Phascolarctid gammaherpesvirus 1]
MCRICFDCESGYEPLLTPCRCSGTMKFIHASCLVKWFKTSTRTQCELCNFNFKYEIREKTQTFPSWREDRALYKQLCIWVALLVFPITAFFAVLCLILNLQLDAVTKAIFVGIMLCAVVTQVSITRGFIALLRRLKTFLQIRSAEIIFFNVEEDIDILVAGTGDSDHVEFVEETE